MKDLSRVLREKERDVERVRREIESLPVVIPRLAKDADWIENGLAPPWFRATGTAWAEYEGRPPGSAGEAVEV